MDRETALMIARRQMDRIELDGALHLDALADEIIAGVALIERDAMVRYPLYGLDLAKPDSDETVIARKKPDCVTDKLWDAYCFYMAATGKRETW